MGDLLSRKEFQRVNSSLPLIQINATYQGSIELTNGKLARLESELRILPRIIREEIPETIRATVLDVLNRDCVPPVNPPVTPNPNLALPIPQVPIVPVRRQHELNFVQIPNIGRPNIIRRQQPVHIYILSECFSNWYIERLNAQNTTAMSQKDRDNYFGQLLCIVKASFLL